MSTMEDLAEQHWRTLGAVVITIIVTTAVLVVGVAIGYNLAMAS